MNINRPAKSLKVFKEAWSSLDTYATTAVTMLIDMYGVECFSWSPATIRVELNEDLGVVAPPPVFDRAMVAINLLSSDSFYKSLPTFNDFCVILSGHSVSYQMFQMADTLDVAWGITEGVLISPPDDSDEEPFVPEIISFIGKVVQEEGIISPPDVLRLGGVRSEIMDRIKMDYSDDPELFQSIWTAEKSKSTYIDQTVRDRLGEMVRQLESLPLINGNPKDIVAAMSKTLATFGSGDSDGGFSQI